MYTDPLLSGRGWEKGAPVPAHTKEDSALTPVTRGARARALSAGSCSSAQPMTRVGEAEEALVRGAQPLVGWGGRTRVACAASTVPRCSGPGPACSIYPPVAGRVTASQVWALRAPTEATGAACLGGYGWSPLEPRQLLPGEGLVGGDNFPRVLRMGVVATTVPACLGSKEPGCRDAHVPERGQWAFPRTEEAANGMNQQPASCRGSWGSADRALQSWGRPSSTGEAEPWAVTASFQSRGSGGGPGRVDRSSAARSGPR